MAPLAEPQPAVPKEAAVEPLIRRGIRAVLFGPPGSGKGTQVHEFFLIFSLQL